VDRQVRAALEQLLSGEPDPSVVRLVKKHVKELSGKDVRASLARMRVAFDLPVEMDGAAPPPPKPARGPTASTATRKTPSVIKVSLKDIIAAGILKPPLKLFVRYKGHALEAELLADGTVRFRGKVYETCSNAAGVARGTVTGRPMSTNGWGFWRYRLPDGKAVQLDSARQEYLKRQSEVK
jgi:hypothetical protein